MNGRPWTPAELRTLRRRYPHEKTQRIADDLGRTLTTVYRQAHKLGLRKTATYLASDDACRLRRGNEGGEPFRFRPGHVPANKGLRRPGWGPGRMKETQFVRGQPNGRAAQLHMPLGTTRVVDGYQYTKVADERGGYIWRNWRPTHVLLWERERGPVPPGHAICFRNGDRTDIRLDNLELVSRLELLRRNSVHRLPESLREVIQLRGALVRKIRRRTA